MTTIRYTRRRERNKKTGKRRIVYDAAIWRGSRFIVGTKQGYTSLKTLQRVLANVAEDMAKEKVTHDWRGLSKPLAVLALLACLCATAFAVNSPRPASWSVQDGALVVTWTNFSTAHPWLVSYADSPGAWRWETNRLASTDGRLVVSRPMTEPVRFFRLWPAAP